MHAAGKGGGEVAPWIRRSLLAEPGVALRVWGVMFLGPVFLVLQICGNPGAYIHNVRPHWKRKTTSTCFLQPPLSFVSHGLSNPASHGHRRSQELKGGTQKVPRKLEPSSASKAHTGGRYAADLK